MAKVSIYSPNNILLPKTLCERFAEALSLTYDYIQAIDTKFDNVLVDGCYPLIHDVFRTADNKRLIAMDSGWHGSRLGRYKKQWVPLKKELLPLKISCNAVEGGRETLKYQYSAMPLGKTSRVGIYEIILSAKLRDMPIIPLDFEWQGFRQSVSVPVNPFAGLDKTPFTLHTMQKNNALLWIKDWCLYYHREHSVNRIVIYDNASDDEAGLVKCLESIDDNIEIVLVRWHYKHFQHFVRCQITGLNHCLALFGDSSQYYLNFDIDEYLVNTTALCLQDYLKQADKTIEVNQQGYHSIPQHIVANYSKKPIINRAPCAGDFEYKIRLPSHRNPKTINIYARIHSKGMKMEYVGIHKTLLGNCSLANRILEKIKIIFHNAIKKIKRILIKLFPRIKRTLIKPLLVQQTQQYLYFNHYMGLNLGNINSKKRNQPSLTQLSKEGYTKDTIMPAKLRKHGLMLKED